MSFLSINIRITIKYKCLYLLEYVKFNEVGVTNMVNQLYGLTIGLIVLFVGVALMYMLPDYIINALNSTGVFEQADVTQANTQADSIRSLGFVVIIIAVVWLIFSVIGGNKPA